jgi:hypothetical protein
MMINGRTILGLTLLVMSAGLSSSEIVHRVVVYTGQQGAGVPGSLYSTLYIPTISGTDQVAFRARLSGVGSFSRDGVWLERDGSMQLLARAGQPSPIDGYSWRTPRNPNMNFIGRVAVQFRLIDDATGGVVEDAIWAEGDSGLVLVARQGQATPFANTTFGSMVTGNSNETVLHSEQGMVAFANSMGGTVTSENDSALFLFDGATVKPIAREGDAVGPGVIRTQFFSDPFGDIVINPTGIVAFTAAMKIGDDQENALFVHDGSTTTLVVNSGAGGYDGLGGDEELGTIHNVMINRSGQVAFHAGIDSEFGGPVSSGVWLLNPGGSPMLMHRNPENGPFIHGINSFLTDLGTVFTRGETSDGVNLTQTIFKITSGGGAASFLAVGDAVPGVPGATFAGFDVFSGNAFDQVAISAIIEGGGVTSGNDHGLWGGLNKADLKLLAREGQSFALTPGDDRTLDRPVLSLGNGPSEGRIRQVTDTGHVLWTGSVDNFGEQMIVETFFGLPPAPPAELIGLESVQVIQDWKNTIPLVADKPTFVRAHLKSTQPQRLVPLLRGYDILTQELPESPLSPINPGATVALDASSHLQRQNPFASALFRLPRSWTGANTAVDIELENSQGTVVCKEKAGLQPNDCTLEMFFQEERVPQVKFVSVNWLKGGVRQKLTRAQRARLSRTLVSAFPIAKVDWTSSDWNWPLAGKPDLDTVLARLTRFRASDNCTAARGCRRIYYAAVPGNSLEGVATFAGTVGTGFTRISATAEGRHTHSHELGHNLDLPHSVHKDEGLLPNGRKKGPCGSHAAGDTPDFPYYFTVKGNKRTTLGPMSSGADELVYGYDSDQNLVVDPNKFFDLMGYCSSPIIDLWPSKHSYSTIRQAIATRFSATPPEWRGPVLNYLLISGQVDPESHEVNLDYAGKVFDSSPPDVSPAGDYTVDFLDSTGGLVASTSFDPELAEARGDVETGAFFLVAQPENAAISRIEISHMGNLQTAIEASDNAPSINLTAPNGGETLDQPGITVEWTADDPDGDALEFTIQYSSDNGVNWQTLSVDWTGTSYEVDREILPAGDEALFRVIGSDGFNIGSDTSDSVFSVANNAPFLVITAPQDQTLVVDGQALTLSAQAFDTEDGPLGGAGVGWDSDRDGILGTGAELTVQASALSVGTHLITATTMDSGSASATDSITVVVGDSAPANLADLMVQIADQGDPVFARQHIEYQVLVANQGPDAAANPELIVDFTHDGGGPGSLTVKDVFAAPGWICNSLAQRVSCDSNALELSEEAVFSVRLQALDEGEVTATASLQADVTEAVGGNNQSVFVTDVGEAQASDTELKNLSTRADVGTGADIAIAGFIIRGSEEKCVVVRGRGPSMNVSGVPLLADPNLTLYSGQTIIDSNDDWMSQADPAQQIIIENLGLAPTDFREAAIHKCLPEGPFTALLRGGNGGTGVGIVEVFDADEGTSILENISTRARVGTGPLVTIAGFIIEGDSPKKILLRGRGPTVGVPAGVIRLSNPKLRLYQLLEDNSNVLLEENDNWGLAANAGEISASGQAPGDPNEAAILMMLDPGVYTGILDGVFGATGSGIIEVIDLSGN